MLLCLEFKIFLNNSQTKNKFFFLLPMQLYTIISVLGYPTHGSNPEFEWVAVVHDSFESQRFLKNSKMLSL